LQKADALEAMKRDLKETVSSLRMEEYKRVLGRAKCLTDLKDIEFEVRVDTRLSPDQREQLLRRVESAVRAVGSKARSEQSHLRTNPESALVWKSPQRPSG